MQKIKILCVIFLASSLATQASELHSRNTQKNTSHTSEAASDNNAIGKNSSPTMSSKDDKGCSFKEACGYCTCCSATCCLYGIWIGCHVGWAMKNCEVIRKGV